MRLIALGLMISQITACATLFGSKDRSVRVVTDPPGALIKHDGQEVGKSPVSFTVTDTSAANQVTADLPGYDAAADVVKTSVEPVTFVNIVFAQFGLIGFVIDWASGSLFGLQSHDLNLKLAKKSSSPERG
ncbi:MAG: hypothetical protein RL011_2031 [Pseudomonadota bacterium]